MELLGVHHVAVVVPDTAAALFFYRDVLGLEVIPRPDVGVGGAWLRAGGPGGQEIHLIERPDATPVPGQHVAFRVGDLDAVVEELRAADVGVRGPNELPNGTRQAFVRDPSGNMVELTQPV